MNLKKINNCVRVLYKEEEEEEEEASSNLQNLLMWPLHVFLQIKQKPSG